MTNFQKIANFEIPKDLTNKQKETLERFRKKITTTCYLGILPEEVIEIFQKYNKLRKVGQLNKHQKEVERLLITLL